MGVVQGTESKDNSGIATFEQRKGRSQQQPVIFIQFIVLISCQIQLCHAVISHRNILSCGRIYGSATGATKLRLLPQCCHPHPNKIAPDQSVWLFPPSRAVVKGSRVPRQRLHNQDLSPLVHIGEQVTELAKAGVQDVQLIPTQVGKGHHCAGIKF